VADNQQEADPCHFYLSAYALMGLGQSVDYTVESTYDSVESEYETAPESSENEDLWGKLSRDEKEEEDEEDLLKSELLLELSIWKELSSPPGKSGKVVLQSSLLTSDDPSSDDDDLPTVVVREDADLDPLSASSVLVFESDIIDDYEPNENEPEEEDEKTQEGVEEEEEEYEDNEQQPEMVDNFSESYNNYVVGDEFIEPIDTDGEVISVRRPPLVPMPEFVPFSSSDSSDSDVPSYTNYHRDLSSSSSSSDDSEWELIEAKEESIDEDETEAEIIKQLKEKMQTQTSEIESQRNELAGLKHMFSSLLVSGQFPNGAVPPQVTGVLSTSPTTLGLFNLPGGITPTTPNNFSFPLNASATGIPSLSSQAGAAPPSGSVIGPPVSPRPPVAPVPPPPASASPSPPPPPSAPAPPPPPPPALGMPLPKKKVVKPKDEPLTQEQLINLIREKISLSEIFPENIDPAVNMYISKFAKKQEDLEKLVKLYPFLIKALPTDPKGAYVRMMLWEHLLFKDMGPAEAAVWRKSKAFEIGKLEPEKIKSETEKIKTVIRKREEEKEMASKKTDILHELHNNPLFQNSAKREEEELRKQQKDMLENGQNDEEDLEVDLTQFF